MCIVLNLMVLLVELRNSHTNDSCIMTGFNFTGHIRYIFHVLLCQFSQIQRQFTSQKSQALGSEGTKTEFLGKELIVVKQARPIIVTRYDNKRRKGRNL